MTQAPRAWYEKIDSYLINSSFIKSSIILYVKHSNGKILLIVVYVDDFIIITGSDEKLIYRTKEDMKNPFKINILDC